MAKKKKTLRIINPYTGFDSADESTYQNSSAESIQAETDRINARLRQNKMKNRGDVRKNTPVLGSGARSGIGLSRFNQLASASSFEEYAKMRRQMEEAEGMRSAADKLGGMFTAHQKVFSPNDRRAAKILPAEQEAMDRAAERGARIAAGESTYEQEMKAAQAEREAKADPVTVKTPQQAAAEALMRNYGYKTVGGQTVFVTPHSPLPKPTAENIGTEASAPFAFDIDPDQYVKDMMAIDRGMGFQAGAKNYKLDPNDPFADLKRRERVAASGAMMEPTIDAETQKILDTYFGGKLPSMDEFNAKYEELYDDVRLTDEEVAYFYHRGSELVGNALNAMEQGPPVLDDETQSFLNKYFGGQIPTADEFNAKYELIYDGTGVSDEYVKAFEEGAGSVEKAIRDAQAYGSAYGDAMIEYGQALGRLGYDAKDYAGLNSEAGYYGRYGLDYNRANVAQAYEDQYKMPGIMGSYDEHDATMQMIKNRGMDTQYSGTDLETGRTLLQSEMDDETAQTYMYLASEYGEEAAQNFIDAMLKGEYNPRAWQIRDKALRAGANENWSGASLRTYASAPGQVAGTAYAIEQALKGEEIDPYDTAFMPAQLTQTPRDEVSRMITRNYGTTDDKGQPVNNAQSYILNALYQAAMSSGDSTLAMLVSGGPHGGMAAATQGLWAWGSGAQDATMRGGNSAQAALLGGVQGLVEMATEALPMEQLAKAFERQNVKAIKDILLMALHGAISEAPGEGLSELGGALADKAIMDELSNWDAAVNEKGVGGAAAQLAGDVLTSMLVGALSGAGTNTAAASLTYGVGKGVDAYQQYRTNKLLKQAAQDLNEVQQQEQSAAQQPAEIPDELATGLEAEYAGAAEEVAENAPEAAEAAQSEAEQAQPEAEQAEEEKPAETPEKAENKDRFKAKKAATLTIDGENSAVDVVGVDSVSDTGLIMLEVEDQNGKRSVVNAADVSFADDASEELMGYAASERMDAKGLRSYMEGYDPSIATPEQYAEAYSSVYSRGRAGVDYDNAALNNSEARQYLSNDAMIAAYAAGENAYNQTHDTVQPAAIETASGNAATPANAKLSAKEGVKTTKTRGRVSRQYSQAAFSKLGKEGRRNAMSQMELLGALASRTGHTIRVVDSLVGKDGKKANAMYDPRTREITVALDATGGAYAYAAAHELTHALRNEHKSEWNGFRDFVRGALERNGQVWEDLVKYQQDRFGYNREDAEEEVICNTVPALLKDERNLFELYKGNRTLFDRVVNWVKGLLEDVKNAGQALSSRSQSWAQMDALANDRKALQDIYDMMMRIMEGQSEEQIEENIINGVQESVMEAPVDASGNDVKYSLTTYTEELPKPIGVARAKKLGVDHTVRRLGGAGKRTVIASGRNVTEALMRYEGWSEAQISKVLTYTDKIAKWFEKAVGKYEYVNLQDVNDASIMIDHNTGEIVFSCQVPNAEYKVNFDFTTVCRQREAVQRFIDELSGEQGKNGTKLEDISLTAQNIWKLNEILKDEGYETACLGCFVEAKRYRIKAQADTLVQEWNDMVRAKNPNAEYFGFATGDTDLMKMSDEEIHKLEASMRGYNTKGTSKATQRAERLIELPEMQKLIRSSDIVSRQGRKKIREFSPALESFLVSRFGQGGAKPAVGFMPYNSEIAALPDTKSVGGKRMSLQQYLEMLGGARSNSFSDYIPSHALDYIQRTLDMAARRTTAQCYTKVPARARTFGRTGEKINMSVMFDIDAALHWSMAGLNASGEYIVGDKAHAEQAFKETGVRAFTQSIPFDEAVAIEHDPAYAENCGIIGVGYAYRHIAKMMGDDNVPYIIPYHRSSMPDAVARASNTKLATNYEDVQNTTRVTGYAVVANLDEGEGTPSYAMWPEGKKKTRKSDLTYDMQAALKRNGGDAKKTISEWLGWMADNNLTPNVSTAMAGHGDFDMYASLRKTKDPAKTANEYMAYCIEKGMTPVFFEFADQDGYDKTLFDFSVRNLVTGKTSLQGPVTFDWIDQMSAEDLMAMMDADMSEYNEYNREQFGSEKWNRVKEKGYEALQDDEIAPSDRPEFKYSVRDEDPPKNVIYGYKAFKVYNGRLYPPQVSNDVSGDMQKSREVAGGKISGGYITLDSTGAEYYIGSGYGPNGLDTPVGVWLDSDYGSPHEDSSTGEMTTNSNGRLQVINKKGSSNGGTLAYRPGWHLGPFPDAKQFYSTTHNAMTDNIVFCRVAISADYDYQLAAMSAGVAKEGSKRTFDHTQAGLPYVPKDGFYKYRTNANPTTWPWIIAGSMKVVEILDDDDCDAICAKFGVEPARRISGKKINLEEWGLKHGPVEDVDPGDPSLDKYRMNERLAATRDKVKSRLERSDMQEAYHLDRPIDFSKKEIRDDFLVNGVDPEYYQELYDKYGDGKQDKEHRYGIPRKAGHQLDGVLNDHYVKLKGGEVAMDHAVPPDAGIDDLMMNIDNIRYSMQDIDDEYMAAVKAGDEEKMIRMVDAAAAKAGYQGMFYHGSDAFGFTEFDMDMMDDGASIFLARSVDVSGTYTRNPELKTIRNGKGNGGIYQLYAKLGNTLVLDGEGKRWNELEPPYEMAQALMYDDSIADGEEFETREIAAWARENGYDSVEFNDIMDTGKYNDGFADERKAITDIVALFDPSSVKSADLITYDAKGNVIPLSERFRNDSNDIRYSLIDSDDNVRDAAKSAQSAFGMIRGHYITAAEADKLAGSLLKASNSDYDRQRLAAEISRTMDYIERGEDVDIMQVFDELTSMGARVMEKSKTLDLDHEERMKPIRDYLKTTKIRLTDKQRAEAESAAGSYGAYRKGVFGRVRLVSNGGVPLDSAWQELSQMDPELFPADAREGDMPALLQAAVDASKPVYHDGTGMTTEEGANWIALQLIDEYLKLPAVKAAVKNAKTFGESLTDLNKAVKRYKDTSWSEYQNALRAINEARDAKTKGEKQKELAAMRKKYKEWRDRDAAQRRERELKRRYRARIEATVKQLTDWMAKPTDAKHIPAGLEDTIRRMLESLDFSGKDTKTAKLLSERLSNLADVLQRAQESGEENQSIFLERDQQMIDEIRRVAELIRGNTEFQGMEGRGIYDLNGLELKELSKWLDVIKHNVIEASKLIGSELPYESVDEAAQLSMMELSGKKPLKDKKWIPEKWYEFFGPDMWDSFSFFERLGATANEIFKGLRRGFDRMTQLTREAEVFTKKLLDGVDLKKTTGKKAEKITYTTTHGETLELTRGNIMEIYVLSRREQATGHMYGGGILIANSKDAMPKVLTKADVAKLTGMLSKDELRIADGLQRFLSKEAAAWGNATSRKLVGYNKFGEEFYWPINTDPNTRMTTKLEDNYAADINAIKNQGMTKATLQGASNAIVIGDIFDTYVRHISNMAAYAAYAIPLSDFTRWYNARGVKTQIDHIMGKKGLEYINNFLMAVNGSGLRIDQSGLSRLSAKLTRNAKIASVGANLRVVIQQPTSYARAALMISPKYLTAALTMKAPKKDLIDKYCGIAQWKHWGFYETNIGPSLRGVIVDDAGGMEKAREAATWLAGKGDDWTLNHLWNACALEAKDRGYVEGSEGYYRFVGDRMSEIIDRTQVVDSVFHRSQIMRSKNPVNQMLTNFMSEPNKTFNLLMIAIEEYASNRKNKAAKIKLARTLATYAVTGVMTAAAAAVIDAFRDEDDEKEWLEKYGSALLGNMGDNLNPLGLLPGVKDVLSFIQGYSNSAGRMDTQSIQKIIWAADEIRKAINGESKMSLYGLSYKTAQALSSLFGLPVSNVMRDLNAIVQTATGRTITKNAEARRSQTAGLLYDAMMGESKRDAKKLREELSGRAGMNPKEIDEQLAIRLAEEPEIAQAYEAKVKRDYATMNRIRNSFTARGFGGETFDRALEKYRNSYIKEKASEIAEDDLVIEAYNAKQAGQDATVEQKTKALMDRGYTQEAISEAISMYGKTQKDMDAQLESTLFTTDEAAGAIRVLAGLEKGTVTESDLKLMVSERVAASSAADPEKSARDSIVSALKGTYLDLDAKGDTAGMKRLAKVMKDQLGTEQAKLDGWVSDKRGEDLRAAVDAYDVSAAGKVVQKLRKEGATDSTIKSRLSSYKQKYIDAVNRKDTVAANKIKRTLIGLGLMSKKGEPLYKEETFADWLKTK